jgi:hypothetical protein
MICLGLSSQFLKAKKQRWPFSGDNMPGRVAISILETFGRASAHFTMRPLCPTPERGRPPGAVL